MENSLLYVKHKEIDKQLWDEAIAKSHNGLVYAHSHMLDAMSPGWDALILQDYEYIMPLTWRKKWGFRYLCQPAFCQQLGIFSQKPINKKLTEAFLHEAANHFRFSEIYLNHAIPNTQGLPMQNNFLLWLKKPYKTIQENYKTDLVKNLTRASRFQMDYTHFPDIKNAIGLYKEHYGNRLGYHSNDYLSLTLLCTHWQTTGKCFARAVYLKEKNLKELLAVGLFLKDEKRIYNIASTTLPNGRTLEANPYLFDKLIEEFSNQALWLDFEGSDLPGVARFYQKFNPENHPYFFWRKNKLPRWAKWLKT
jgi:hypothetical protein